MLGLKLNHVSKRDPRCFPSKICSLSYHLQGHRHLSSAWNQLCKINKAFAKKLTIVNRKLFEMAPRAMQASCYCVNEFYDRISTHNCINRIICLIIKLQWLSNGLWGSDRQCESVLLHKHCLMPQNVLRILDYRPGLCTGSQGLGIFYFSLGCGNAS